MTKRSARKPVMGDVVWRSGSPLHFHCGIYENDASVIHFAKQNGSSAKKEAVIHRSTLAEFAKGSPVFVIEFPQEKCLSPDETVQRASSRLGEKAYNLFLNNCDHFATWCKIDEYRSVQVDLVKKIAVAVAKKLDERNKNETQYEAVAEIFCGIYEILETFYSPKSP